MNSRSILLALRASSAALAMTAAAGAALAQAAAPPASPSTNAAAVPAPNSSPPIAANAGSTDSSTPDAKEIVVTGSRLGRTGYDAPTPVNVVGDQRLKALAITNIADALNQIPSFRALTSPASNVFRVSGNIAGRQMDLRGLGPTRTLTLVDGHRFVSSSDNNTVDLNSIPTIMIQQTEVVTGGASAAYGADAVAGVVNIILNKKLQGIKLEGSSGISSRGDGRSTYLAGAGGWDFGGGRGHVVIGAEYLKDYGIGECEVRPYCARYTNYVSNPNYNSATRTSLDGRPATLVLNNVMFAQNANGVLTGARTTGGVALSQQAGTLPVALQGKQFDINGNVIPYTFGSNLSGLFAVYPNGDPTQPYLLGLSPMPLIVADKHISAMAHADYDLTDHITLSTEFMFAHVVGGPTRSTPPLDNPASIDVNNPYLSASTKAVMQANNLQTLLVNSSSAEVSDGISIGTSKLNTYRGLIALKGDLGHSWTWDLSYTYGRVHGFTLDKRNRLKAWNNAVNAVAPPAGYTGPVYQTPSGGSVICASSVAAPTNGCIPLDLFGYQPLTAAQFGQYFSDEWQTRTYQQHVIGGNVRGTPFKTWAGDVKVAVGGEYRRDTAVGDTDLATLQNLYISPALTALPYTKTEVAEGYVEAGVPLLKDSALGKALDIDGAIRRTHYNKFGSAWTWKIGGVYTIVPDITFRVTRSRDIRAPTAQESSPNTTSIALPLADFFKGGTTLQNVVTGGNPNLKLETADTFTAGVVLKPRFLRRFNMSVDYYNIKVKGAIDALTQPLIGAACRNSNLLCNLITFNADGSMNTVLTNYQNLSKLHAEGIEIVADYRLPAFGGNIDFNINGNYVIDLSTLGGTGVTTQYDNITGNAGSASAILGVPRWKANMLITYSNKHWALTGNARYIPWGYLDSTKTGPEEAGYNVNDPNSISTNRVDPAFYLDLTLTAKIAEDKYEVFLNVNNVFDKQEPAQLRLFGNAIQFDPMGRYFRVGARAKF